MITFYDGPNALVTERVLVVRAYPSQDYWIHEIEHPQVVGRPIPRAQLALAGVAASAALLTPAWLMLPVLRPETLLVNLIALVGSGLALARLSLREPRRYDLCAVYGGAEVVLLRAVSRRDLVCIAKAVEFAKEVGSGHDLDTGDSTGRAA